MKQIVCIFLFEVLFIHIARAQHKPNFEELEKTIVSELEANGTPGAAVLIIFKGEMVFSKGYGTTSSEDGQQVTTKTLFRLGSTTKMFTAAMLVNLANQGKIKLDSPIGNYLKNLDLKISRLTAHQLLSHTSGLREFAPKVESNDDSGLKENILLWKDDVFFTEPGKIYSYSSANYWLAGLLAEEIYGKPYSDAISEIILRPLGMDWSTIRPFEAMTYPLALGHNIVNDKAEVIRPIPNNVAKYPAGSLYSNIQELGNWALAFLNDGKLDGEQILEPSIIEQLKKPQVLLPYEEKVFYGYGLIGYEAEGINFITHGGVSSGYGSTIDFAPDQKFAVIVLANSNGETLPESRQKAYEMFLPLKKTEEASTTSSQFSDTDMNKYIGKYESGQQMWRVYTREGKLLIKIDDNEFELIKTGKNSFGFEQGGIIFVPNEKGTIEHIFTGLYAAKKVE